MTVPGGQGTVCTVLAKDTGGFSSYFHLFHVIGVSKLSLTLTVWVRLVQQHRVQHRFSVVPCCGAFEAQKVFVLFL